MSVDKNLVFSMSCFDVLFLGGFWGFLQLNKHTEQTIVAQPELFVELENKQWQKYINENTRFLTTDIKHVNTFNENTMFVIEELETCVFIEFLDMFDVGWQKHWACLTFLGFSSSTNKPNRPQ
jgi:hypothetical protein